MQRAFTSSGKFRAEIRINPRDSRYVRYPSRGIHRHIFKNRVVLSRVLNINIVRNKDLSFLSNKKRKTMCIGDDRSICSRRQMRLHRLVQMSFSERLFQGLQRTNEWGFRSRQCKNLKGMPRYISLERFVTIREIRVSLIRSR